MVAKILQGFSDCNYLGCKNIFSFYRPMKKTEVQFNIQRCRQVFKSGAGLKVSKF